MIGSSIPKANTLIFHAIAEIFRSFFFFVWLESIERIARTRNNKPTQIYSEQMPMGASKRNGKWNVSQVNQPKESNVWKDLNYLKPKTTMRELNENNKQQRRQKLSISISMRMSQSGIAAGGCKLQCCELGDCVCGFFWNFLLGSLVYENTLYFSHSIVRSFVFVFLFRAFWNTKRVVTLFNFPLIAINNNRINVRNK